MCGRPGALDRLETGVARLQAEEQQRLLNRELSHRMKNMMTLVQAITVQTLKVVPDKTPVKLLTERLMALGVAHDVLLEQDWVSVSLANIVKTTVCTLGDLSRFDIAGAKITLGPRTALQTSLVLHELTANALKYGALSCEKGRVKIDWEVENVDDDPVFQLHWRELDGPNVTAPNHKGFGSRLLSVGLSGTGGTQIRYEPLGVEADFTTRLAEIQT
jgi:two-component sensor histidine kinase